ncbi:transcription antitermination protein NusG [Tropheryma whipplei TW08/27]|nr:transcription antitermination protein NusG [Tropheryma whipplei TW08/27]
MEKTDTAHDPYEEFKVHLRSLPGKWYVVHSPAGFERRAKANLETRVVSMNADQAIYQVEVPMEDVVGIRNGQRKMITRVRIPGYVLVRMDLNESSWAVVRNTPWITGFVGNMHQPVPLSFEEVFDMLKTTVSVSQTAARQKRSVTVSDVDLEVGETVVIKTGSFAGLPGTISEIKPENGRLTVLISLFERETPVELAFDQVEKQA